MISEAQKVNLKHFINDKYKHYTDVHKQSEHLFTLKREKKTRE